jgi:hypothetical protein
VPCRDPYNPPKDIDPTFVPDILGHGEMLGRWVTPEKWAGGGNLSLRDIDLRERIVWSVEIGPPQSNLKMDIASG